MGKFLRADLDAFVGAYDGTVYYYQNNNGTFTNLTGTDNPLNGVDVASNSRPTFADIDSDGDLDAFVGAYDGTVYYYRNSAYQVSIAAALLLGKMAPPALLRLLSISQHQMAD